ncbi:MAG: ABC transporter substrate-binding protein [Solimonas sp.]
MLGFGLLAAACSRTPAKAKLVIGDQKGGMKTLLEASGQIDGIDYPVEWTQFQNAAPLLEALRAGAIDVGIGGDAPFVFVVGSGADIKAIGAVRTTGPATTVMVRGDSDIHELQDLVGKRIATPRGSIGQHLILAWLRSRNLPLDAVQFAFLAPNDGQAALLNGAVDAWSIWDPYAAAGELLNGMRILPVERGLAPGLAFVFSRPPVIAERRGQLEDFIARLAKARQWAEQNRDRYAAVFSKETGMPLQVAQRYTQRSVMVSVPVDDRVIADEQGIADLFVDAGLLDRGVDVASAFDRSFHNI